MELGEFLSLAMFASVCGALLFGFPVAYTLSGVALMFAFLGELLGTFNLNHLGAIPNQYFGVMQNGLLLAVPLFVFMGVMLGRTKIAEELLYTMAECFRQLHGGLGMSVTVVGALLAASTGILGATVVTMGLISLPAMLKAKYSPALACGSICAASTLGQIIPPSIVLVILADVLAGGYTQAMLAEGKFIHEPFSVVDLFAGAFIPGMLLVGLYLTWQIVVALIWPRSCPPVAEKGSSFKDLLPRIFKVLIPPVLLIVSVLGSIIFGFATPTEAASFGAFGALLLSLTKRQLNLKILQDVMRSTAIITCMVYGILLGAAIFSVTFRGLGGDHFIKEFLTGLPGGAFTAMLIVMIVMFLLGFILDFIEIVFVVVPIVAPALLAAGISPVWLGVMLAINIQTSFLTPPFGFALFFLRGVAPAEVRTIDIYKGVAPFVGLQIAALAIVAAFPGIATWLPSVLLD